MPDKSKDNYRILKNYINHFNVEKLVYSTDTR